MGWDVSAEICSVMLNIFFKNISIQIWKRLLVVTYPHLISIEETISKIWQEF